MFIQLLNVHSERPHAIFLGFIPFQVRGRTISRPFPFPEFFLQGCQAALTSPMSSFGSDGVTCLWIHTLPCLWIHTLPCLWKSNIFQRVTVSPFSQIHCPVLPGLYLLRSGANQHQHIFRLPLGCVKDSEKCCTESKNHRAMLIVFLPELRNLSFPLAVMGREEDRSSLSQWASQLACRWIDGAICDCQPQFGKVRMNQVWICGAAARKQTSLFISDEYQTSLITINPASFPLSG